MRKRRGRRYITLDQGVYLGLFDDMPDEADLLPPERSAPPPEPPTPASDSAGR